jgi:iron complex transport system permease protein
VSIDSRPVAVEWSLAVAMLILLIACICLGSVDIPLSDVLDILTGARNVADTSSVIILQSRIPSAITALLAGGALGLSGLLLQTTFSNPLAGPSILGVSTGASLVVP